MKFKLIIDKTKEEEVAVTVHERSSLTEQIEALVMQHTGSDRIIAYSDDEMKQLSFDDIECITVLDGKTYAIDARNKRYRLKQRSMNWKNCFPQHLSVSTKVPLQMKSILKDLPHPSAAR